MKPRLYGGGGWGVYFFDYDNRPYTTVHGPYCGGGVEFFLDQSTAVALDYKAVFYLGSDLDGSGAQQASVLLSWYW